jgi:hypothetical protein
MILHYITRSDFIASFRLARNRFFSRVSFGKLIPDKPE